MAAVAAASGPTTWRKKRDERPEPAFDLAEPVRGGRVPVYDPATVAAFNAMLASGLRGHYNGIILTQADLFTPSGSGFTLEEWQRLHAYERDFGVRESVIADGGGELVVWSWYDIEGRVTTSNLVAKLWGAQARLAGRRHGSAAVAVATRAVPDREAAIARLRSFLEAADLGLPELFRTR